MSINFQYSPHPTSSKNPITDVFVSFNVIFSKSQVWRLSNSILSFSFIAWNSFWFLASKQLHATWLFFSALTINCKMCCLTFLHLPTGCSAGVFSPVIDRHILHYERVGQLQRSPQLLLMGCRVGQPRTVYRSLTERKRNREIHKKCIIYVVH